MRQIGVTKVTYYRWRNEYGGLKGTIGNFVWGHYDDHEGDIAWHAARNPAFPTTCSISCWRALQPNQPLARMARTIAERLGGGVTRNAVIGKAHRLGLPGKQGSKQAALKRARSSPLRRSNQQLQRKTTPKNRAR